MRRRWRCVLLTKGWFNLEEGAATGHRCWDTEVFRSQCRGWQIRQVERETEGDQLSGFLPQTIPVLASKVPCPSVWSHRDRRSYVPWEVHVPWLVWLRGLTASLRTEGSQVRSAGGAHALAVGQAPSRGPLRGNYTWMFLSLSFSLSSPLSKNKNKCNPLKKRSTHIHEYARLVLKAVGCTLVLPHPQGIRPKTPSGCPKSQVVLNPKYVVFS